MNTAGYAAYEPTKPLAPYSFARRDLRPDDVLIEILYCGVCHTDLHFARNDWGISEYPLVPGHEIVGRVTEVGSTVTSHVAGDVVAVGTLIDSCQHCDQCAHDAEQMCRNGAAYTYGSHDLVSGDYTQGGYSNHIVVRDKFVLKVPGGLDLSRVGPLVCAGITSYSPLKTCDVGPGTRVGVVGIGGLGHLAVKFAVAMGADVSLITRSADKAEEASLLGVNKVVLSTSSEAMTKAASTFDVIIDTIPVDHDIAPYIGLLDIEGTLAIVGNLGKIDISNDWQLLGGRRRVIGSGTGGLAETQEMLNFCAAHNVLPECEIIAMQDINNAFERMEGGDVRYRFVIDMATLIDA